MCLQYAWSWHKSLVCQDEKEMGLAMTLEEQKTKEEYYGT